MNLPILFPNQIEGFMKKLNMRSPRQTNGTSKFVEKLSSVLLEESPYKNLPEYNYNQMEKGVTCSRCFALETNVHGNKLICKKCGNTSEIDSEVLNSVREYQLLFPDKKITTSAIYKWCKVIESKKTILRVLKKNFVLMNHGQSSYFESPHAKND